MQSTSSSHQPTMSLYLIFWAHNKLYYYDILLWHEAHILTPIDRASKVGKRTFEFMIYKKKKEVFTQWWNQKWVCQTILSKALLDWRGSNSTSVGAACSAFCPCTHRTWNWKKSRNLLAIISFFWCTSWQIACNNPY